MGRRQLYTMGEIAARVGLSRQTLHVYCRRGYIVPTEVSPGGHRLFSGKVVRRLDEIRARTEAGLPPEVRTARRGADDPRGGSRR